MFEARHAKEEQPPICHRNAMLVKAIWNKCVPFDAGLKLLGQKRKLDKKSCTVDDHIVIFGRSIGKDDLVINL